MSSGRAAVRLILSAVVVLLIVGGYFLYRGVASGRAAATVGRLARLRQWFSDPDAHPEWAISASGRCGDAPFQYPTSGYIGFVWGDSFRIGHRHQGQDIFGGQAVGVASVVAAYPGYLSRLPEWKSSLIIRLPQDPLHPERQIWTYYTHLADASGASYISPEFPPGTSEVYVEAGTLLGYQGNYSGDPDNPTGVHLHFSIVLDDGQGRFRNELVFGNTLDPSPYFGLSLNAADSQGEVPVCMQ